MTGKWTIKADDKKIIRSDLRDRTYEVTAIFPNQRWSKVIELEEGLLESAKKKERSLFVGVSMRDKCANNNVGESGMIFEFGKNTLNFGSRGGGRIDERTRHQILMSLKLADPFFGITYVFDLTFFKLYRKTNGTMASTQSLLNVFGITCQIAGFVLLLIAVKQMPLKGGGFTSSVDYMKNVMSTRHPGVNRIGIGLVILGLSIQLLTALIL